MGRCYLGVDPESEQRRLVSRYCISARFLLHGIFFVNERRDMVWYFVEVVGIETDMSNMENYINRSFLVCSVPW